MQNRFRAYARRRAPALLLAGFLAACEGEGPGGLPAASTPEDSKATDSVPESSEPDDAGRAAKRPEPGPPAVEVPPPLARAREAVRQRPDDAAAQRALGEALLRYGFPGEAIEAFAAAARLDPGARSQFDLGRAYSAASRLDEAEAAYRRVLALRPGDARTHHNLANVRVKRGDPETALSHYRAAIEAEPRYLSAYLHLSELLQAQGLVQQALGACLGALEIDPRNPREQGVYNELVHRVGQLMLELGEAAEAEGVLSQLLAAYPDHPGARYTRGRALMMLGRTEEARSELELHMRQLADTEPSAAAAGGGR